MLLGFTYLKVMTYICLKRQDSYCDRAYFRPTFFISDVNTVKRVQ